MKKTKLIKRGIVKRILFSVSIFLLLSSSFLLGQSLQSRIDNLKQLQRLAIEADREGSYDRAIELARQIQVATDDITSLVNVSRKWYVLQNKINLARQLRAEKYAPEEYANAKDYYEGSYELILENSLEDADYAIDEGIYYADVAIELSRELYVAETNKKTEVMESGNTITIEKMPNNEYVVRLIPSRRDSLWRIAEYDFIYGDPFKWPIIYDANRDQIKDPDLIYPGQSLIIPAIPESGLQRSIDNFRNSSRIDAEDEIPEYPEDEESTYYDVPEYPEDEENTIAETTLYEDITTLNFSVLQEAAIAASAEGVLEHAVVEGNAYDNVVIYQDTPPTSTFSILEEATMAEEIN